jgi:peptidyl-prolyl cis-trans isomerase D
VVLAASSRDHLGREGSENKGSMLRFFRSEGVGQVLVFGIVVAIILVFALEFRAGGGSPTASLKQECAVEVGRECLDAKDFFAAYGLVSYRGLQAKTARALSLRQQVLDGLAERELLYAEARRLGLFVSDEVVDQELAAGRAHVSLPAAQAERLASTLGLCRLEPPGVCEPGSPIGVRQIRVRRTPNDPFDYAIYEREIRLLANRGPKEFRAAQERELVAERLRELVRARARVSDSEAFALYERGSSKAVVRSAILERSWFGKYAVPTDDASIEKWTATHLAQVDEAWKADKDKFKVGCPIVSEIAVALPPNALDAEKAPLKERIDAFRARAEKGEDFATLAREAGGAESALVGGRIGCLHESYGLGAKELLAAVEKLAPGALSSVVETPRALHVLKLEGKLAADAVEREGKKQLARSLYVKFAQDDAMRAFAANLLTQLKAGAKLEDLVRAASDEIARKHHTSAKPAAGKKDDAESIPGLLAPDRPRFEVSAPFSISGNPIPDVIPRETLAPLAFGLANPDAVLDRPIETETGLVVMQLKEKTTASRAEFDKEKWDIIRRLSREKGEEALARYVADLKRAAGDKLKTDAKLGEEPKASEGM